MTVLVASLIDATLILALGLALTAALRRRSAAVRHAVLTAAIVCAGLMPVFELLVPQLPVIRWMDSAVVQSSGLAFVSDGSSAETAAVTAETSRLRTVPWPALLVGLWAAAGLVTLAGLVSGLWRLRKLRASCTPVSGHWRAVTDSLARECGVTRPVALLQSQDPTLLVTYGWLRPGIILPAGAGDWTDDRQRIVLRHELAHIRRHDAGIQVAGEVLRVMQPFSPLVWMACRRLRQESEYACDDAVLRAGVEATDYAVHLFDVAKRLSGRQTVWASAPAIADPSTLERRIVAMLQQKKNRQPLTPRGWTLAAALALAVSLPLAAVGLAPESAVGANSTVANPATPAAPEAAPNGARPGQATLSGLVEDQTGGRIPGATITVNSLDADKQYVSTTNARGGFAFDNLPPAAYELVAQLAGFRRVRMSVYLSAGTPTNLTVMMPVGALTEAVTVTCPGAVSSLLQMVFPTLSAQELPAAPIRIGGHIKAPRKTTDVRPACPAGGVTDDVVVLLEAQIGVDGLISDITPIGKNDGSGPPAAFVESATDAIQKWEFTPTMLNNMPVEVAVTISVVFKGA
jgi:beta-lactamase regulating signal transducer with metallopeptidase domain